MNNATKQGYFVLLIVSYTITHGDIYCDMVARYLGIMPIFRYSKDFYVGSLEIFTHPIQIFTHSPAHLTNQSVNPVYFTYYSVSPSTYLD